MIEKSGHKNQSELSSSVTPLLIVGNDRLAPYIQVFSHQPENIVQHTLGCLFGIFKIDNTDVDSAFIVNFLVSEIKKEYYGNPRRTPAGSFEAGLNRINIALSELAKQGNISWIGKLESAICALEKNGMIHFSVTGRSHIALFREGSLSLISEGLSVQSETPNPLKTFTEISSGKLHPQDLVILGTQELFNFLPHEKMERNARHFSYEEFTRFLHTALVNEFDFCGAVTASVHKKISSKTKKTVKAGISTEDIPNLWGSPSFQRNPNDSSQKTISSQEDEKTNSSTSEIQRDGHIYIQQTISGPNSPRQEFKESMLILREHLANIADDRWEAVCTTARQWRRALKKTAHALRENMPSKAQDTLKTPLASDNSFPNKRPLSSQRKRIQEKTEIFPDAEQSKKKSDTDPRHILSEVRSQKKLSEKLAHSKEEQHAPLILKIKIFPSLLKNSTAFVRFCARILRKKCNRKNFQHIPGLFKRYAFIFRFLQNFFLAVVQNIVRIVKKSFPFFRQLFTRFQALPANYRIVGAIAVSLVILSGIILLVTSSLRQTPEQKTTSLPENATAPDSESPQIPSEPSNQLPSAQTAIVYTSQNEILDLFPIDNETFVVVEDRFITLVSEKTSTSSFPLPSENGRVIDATYMKNLSLLFLLTEKGVLTSFSPVSKKFSSNNLVIGNASYGKTFIGSYLTYLYVANTAENSIIRYPRAEGGFGTPTPWLLHDSGISLAGVTNLFVNESVYLARQNSILRLSNKKTDPWALDTPSSDSTFGSVFVSENADTVLVTDTKKNKLLFFSKTGDSQKEIPLPDNASKFVNAVMTDKGTVYAQTDHEVQVLP